MQKQMISNIIKHILSIERKYNRVKTVLYLSYIKLRYFWINIDKGLLSYGKLPFIHASIAANITIGKNAVLVNSTKNNFIGIFKNCSIVAYGVGKVIIGNNLGCSGVSICSYNGIEIGNHVMIGANTMIFDTDFHSLNHIERRNELQMDYNLLIISKPIRIGNDVFIGANCLITKGVILGDGSCIGAGSVVTHNVPPYEIWAGNPARFIKKVYVE